MMAGCLPYQPASRLLGPSIAVPHIAIRTGEPLR